jgi:hypothetical protein
MPGLIGKEMLGVFFGGAASKPPLGGAASQTCASFEKSRAQRVISQRRE